MAINTAFLFFTFLLGRVFVQVYLIYFYAIDWISDTWFEREGVPLAYKIILIEMAAAVMVNVVLNFWWSWLIIRQALRLIRGGQRADETFDGSKEEGKDRQENGPADANNLDET